MNSDRRYAKHFDLAVKHCRGVDIEESFNGKLRDELLDRKIFYTLLEAKVLIKRWRKHYNRVCPYSLPGYRPPAPEAFAVEALAAGCAMLRGAPVHPPPILPSNGVGLT